MSIDRAFQPLFFMPILTQAVAGSPASQGIRVGLGWYSVAPSALDLAEDQPLVLNHCTCFVRLALMGGWPGLI